MNKYSFFKNLNNNEFKFLYLLGSDNLEIKKNNEFMLETPDNWNLLKSKKTGEVVYLLFQHNASVI